jgi:hypothetical protein
MNLPSTITIGIIGGTGKEGKGLAYRWMQAGYHIIIGSRSLEKAVAAAQELNDRLGVPMVEGMENADAARNADLAVLTVPYAAHVSTLEAIRQELAGKILIDVTVPLNPPKVTKVKLPPAGSAAQEAQNVLGPEVQVVSAFQNVSYEHLMDDHAADCDVLVCGGDKSARGMVIQLVRDAGLDAWDAGPIENAVVAEGLTSILIGINKQYGVQSAGIRITGVKNPEAKE